MIWEQVEGAESSPDGAEFFWDRIDINVPPKEFRLINCQSCSQSLRVPTTYDGSISCPKCLVKFSTENAVPKEKKKTGLFVGAIEFLMFEVLTWLLVLPIVIVLSLVI